MPLARKKAPVMNIGATASLNVEAMAGLSLAAFSAISGAEGREFRGVRIPSQARACACAPVFLTRLRPALRLQKREIS
jgi:hypothetical protein